MTRSEAADKVERHRRASKWWSDDVQEALSICAASARKLDEVEKWLDNEVFGLPEDDYEKGWMAACKAVRHRIARREEA